VTSESELASPGPDPDPRQDARTVAAGATLSVVAIATFLLLPQLIEATVEDLHYTEAQVGILSALIMAGLTIASLASSLWVRRSSWRAAAALALLGLLAVNVVSMFCHGLIPFLALQGIGGLFGGSLYSLSLTVLSDGRRPDRGFAYAIGAQTLYQIFALVAGPFMIRHGGVNAMLGLFAGLCVLGALLVAFLPAHGRSSRTLAPAAGLLHAPVVYALAGCFLFYVNINAYWTYIERIGTAAGLGLSAISNSLAFGTAASMGGVFLASWLGVRRGLLLPIAASAVTIVVAALLLTGALHLTAYVVSAVIYGNAWNLSMTYQYSTINVVDRSGRGVALAPAFHTAGGAAGAAFAALFVSEHDHGSVIWIVCVSVLASVACFMIALRLRARAAAADASAARSAATS
jgi:predicted MFS family arabinose efflux permease